MTTARIVRLGAGESISLMVESATEVEGQYGKQVRFDGQTAESEDVTIFLPLDTANRQLERIGATLTTIAASIVKIEKVAKDGKTFININRVGAAAKTPVRPTSRATPPSVGPLVPEPEWLDGVAADEEAFVANAKATVPNVDRWFRHYDQCFAHACELARRTKNPDTVVTLEGISAIAATLFIATKSAI